MIDYSLQVSRYTTLVSLISDLDLGDLNYLLSFKPTLIREGFKWLLLITKQTFAIFIDGRLNSILSGLWRKLFSLQTFGPLTEILNLIHS
ncbi:MAG: hypothetical protein B7X71_02715 [Polynucleobacter sp. 39-46-10]|nr:MAG: hypothetical protein B7Y67_06940 [Polynucleobacter sp. 35-46-11]OZA78034.1 MAG: hypothetical protein B7X71_02715 [Polynucleobacter sp. 39-46-10]